MRISELKSSQIESASYDDETQILTVAFKAGGTYEYKDVPLHEWNALITARSIGSHFSKEIKGLYAYRKVEEAVSETP